MVMGMIYGFVIQLHLNPSLLPNVMAFRIAGTTGGQFASNPKQLEALVNSHQNVIYAPDAGDAQNPDLKREIRKIQQAIADQGKELLIAWWGQEHKPGLDIDEVEFDQIELISWAKWLEITGEDGNAPWLISAFPE